MDQSLRFLEPDDATLARMEEIGLACFGSHYSIDQITKAWLKSDRRTRFVGVHDGGRLVAFNGFIAHPATRSGEPVLLFQSCQSATDPAYRGQGLFSRIISHAKDQLQGDYIVGFPNHRSGPIFTGRLGFNVVGLKRVWLPTRAAGLLFDAKRASERLRAPGLCSVDERQAAAWKEKEHPGKIVIYESDGNFIWGMIATRSVGPMPVRFLKAGGAELGNPAHLPHSLRSLGKAAGVELVQFLCTDTSPLAVGARVPLSGERTEPLIWFPLRPGGSQPLFGVCNGLKDVW